MLKFLTRRALVLSVALWFFAFNSAPAVAGLVGSKPPFEVSSTSREEDLSKIQRVLESKEVQEKLKAYGLTKEEVENKLSQLNDEQIHLLAKASDKVLAGGDVLGFTIGVLIVAILVVVLLRLLNKEIIIR